MKITNFEIEDERLWWYRGLVTRVVDGDTIDVVIDRGFLQYGVVRLRLLGIDTPELRDKDVAKRKAAQLAKARVEDLCQDKEVLIRTRKAGAFGRWLAEVLIPSEGGKMVSLEKTLLKEGHAKPYPG